MKTAAPYLVSLKSYSKNIHPPLSSFEMDSISNFDDLETIEKKEESNIEP
jgi:hypothetical protein